MPELETYEDRQMFLEEVGLEESGVSRPHRSQPTACDLQTSSLPVYRSTCLDV